MNAQTMKLSSERGIALIVVLLLMMVLTGLATGFAMTGQIEGQMSQNEVYYAGARAAAEAGLNRALASILANSTTDWIKGADGLVDASNANAAVNADNGSLTFLLGTGPFYVDSNNQYSYDVQILDDDNDLLYETPLTAAQRTSMGEDGSAYSNINDRVVLRATGYGPNGTTIKLARIIETFDSTTFTTTTTTTTSNPAILVNGNFEMNGNITVDGSSGSVHANGVLSKTGASGTVTGSATCSLTCSLGSWTPTGAYGGGRPTINVPNVWAADYMSLADYKLTSSGNVQTKVAGVWTNCTTSACKGIGWSYSGGSWTAGKNPTSATYYVEGNVTVGPTSGSSNNAVSIIAEGNIDVNSGSAKYTPKLANGIQFITNGDLTINAADLDDPANLDGQIMVRGQMDAGGNMEFQGRVLVQDVSGAGSLVADGATRIHGSVHFSYNGTLSAIATTTTTTTGTTTYVNNVSGWMEQ